MSHASPIKQTVGDENWYIHPEKSMANDTVNFLLFSDIKTKTWLRQCVLRDETCYFVPSGKNGCVVSFAPFFNLAIFKMAKEYWRIKWPFQDALAICVKIITSWDVGQGIGPYQVDF